MSKMDDYPLTDRAAMRLRIRMLERENADLSKRLDRVEAVLCIRRPVTAPDPIQESIKNLIEWAYRSLKAEGKID